MKFGKEIASNQVPGWSAFYLDYKGLKKIVSSLVKEKTRVATSPPITTATPASIVVSIDPAAILDGSGVSSNNTEITLLPSSGQDADRGPHFQKCKTKFFFKLQRELEKINRFYLQKEAELKLRLETLLSKRKVASQRAGIGAGEGSVSVKGVEWRAVEEGFRLLEKDLGKLQQFIDINATGFRKILKKWDKRSKSTTKELYLARQVEVQPCFNRQLLSDLADAVTMCLLDLNSSVELGLEGGTTRDFVLSRQLSMDRSAYSGPLADVESNLIAAVSAANDQGVADVIGIMESVLDQDGERTHISRVLWKAATQAPPHLADTIISSSLFTFNFVDDINGRTCLHEAAISGTLRLVSHCVENNIEIDKPDAYGRSALHYASMYGHDLICQRLLLLGAQPNAVDLDNYTPLIYAVVNGKLECVRVLLEDGHIGVEHVEATNSLIPLSLACQFGHVGVALLLLQHGARNVANTNGEYPIHLAAREGHEAICRLLVGQDVTDVPDKYNEWTPLFHAARYGHEKCVTVLLDAGCNPHTVDETSKLAVFYAAWYGHINCVNRLIAVMKAPSISTGTRARVVTSVSPLSDLDAPPEGDLDMIPSLSLPPPIMPFRIYGHDFLDKTYLLQLTLGLPSQNLSSASSSFTLVPNIAGFVEQQHQQSGPSFKLVISAKPDPMSAPHAIVLPLTKTQEIFSFQLPSLEGLAVEFSFYPTFGNKIVGRAVALLSDLGNENGRTLPVFDHHLQVIGQISFCSCIVTPRSGARVDINGSVETYWKSTATLVASGRPVHQPAHRPLSSTATSPSLHSPGFASERSCITITSLSGDYVHAIIQVTKDLIPVVSAQSQLPYDGLDIGVSDLKWDQLLSLAPRVGVRTDLHMVTSSSEWATQLSGSVVKLEHFLNILPASMGISMELVSPNQMIESSSYLNEFADRVLQTVYGASSRHRIVFSSFIPNVCTAFNWKQPNFPVFFASRCGAVRSDPGAPLSPLIEDREELDSRRLSVQGATEFARSNNLLGVLISDLLLDHVPSLVESIKESGLILAAFGTREHVKALSNPPYSDAATIDAILCDGILSFIDHSYRSLV